MEIKVIDFIEKDWEFERSSGYDGYRNNNKQSDYYFAWIYDITYNQLINSRKQYEYDLNLLNDFKTEVLPLGEYPDFHLRDFLNKKYQDKIIVLS